VTGQRGNPLATDLDNLLFTSTPEKVARAIANPVMFMPAFRFSQAQIEDLVNAILAEGRSKAPGRGEQALMVHFEDEGNQQENVFAHHCGDCHKLLSPWRGGLGQGDIGPNLSGLFTIYYPRSVRDPHPWTPTDLSEWLRNPRSLRPLATMQPVLLTGVQIEELCAIIGWPPEKARLDP